MAVYVPPTGVAPADLFEDLARDVTEAYRAAEARILVQLQHAIDRQLLNPDAPVDTRLTQQLDQVQAGLRNIEIATRRLRLNPELAENAIATAAAEGSAAAADRLGLIRVLPAAGPLTSTAASAVVQVALDLRSSLDDVKLRILRFEDDVYRRVIAQSLPNVLLGTTYSIDQQRETVARWLADGIPGFVDKANRRWSTGAYVEMATRTGVSRAYTEASVYRQQQAGLDLVVPVVGASACRSCAQWIGKILSTTGQSGTVTLQHATTGELIEVTIADTLEHARSTSHLNGPNCRCVMVGYLPGLEIPVSSTAYDPEREAARDRQRELERRLRRDKTRLQLSPDGDPALKARIRDTQAELRAHIAEHDLPRKAYREQPSWAGDARTPPRATPGPTPEFRPPTPPRPATPGAAAPTPPPAAPNTGRGRPSAPPVAPAPAPAQTPPPPPAQPERTTFAADHAKSSTADMAAGFEKRHGIPVKVAPKFPAESVRAALTPLSEMLDEFPDARIGEIRVKPLRGGTIAQVTQPADFVLDARGNHVRGPDGKPKIVYRTPDVEISAQLLLDGDAFVAAMKHSAEVGHFTGDAAEITLERAWRQTMTHEFLHVLDVDVQAELRKAYAVELKRELDAVAKANKGRVREAKDEWTKANVSAYGQLNDAEGVAEAFEDYRLNGDRALPFSKLIGPLVEQIVAREL